jgi:protein O-mannosyl-transferase
MNKNKKFINKNIKQPEIWYKDKWIIGGLFILLVTFIVFYPSVKYDFVNWDDDVNITENLNVTNFDINGMFTQSVIGGYNPLSVLSLAIDYKLAKGEPWLFHFNNLLLHLLCSLLVFILLKKLGVSFLVSFLVAFLFGIHPMRVESVAWITERKDVLFAFFYLLSIVLYVEFLKKKKWIFYLISVAIFILSLLSKIQAVSLPLSLLLIDYWLNRKFNLKLILEKLPFFVLSLITGLAGIYFLRQQGSLETGETFPFHQRLFIGSYSFMVYILKSIYPYKLSALHPYTKNLDVTYYLSMIPAILIAMIPVFSFRKNKFITFGILFFIVNIAFLLQVLGAGQGFLAERFTYIPYIGLFLIYAKLVESALHDFPQFKTAIYSIVGIYIFALIVITVNQRNTWKDSITLWNNVIEKHPNSSLAYNNLGHYYRQMNDYENALKNYNRAIEFDPKNSLTFNNRGKIYFDQGKVDLAMADYNSCLSIKPDFAEALANRGAGFGMKKEYDKALTDLNRALELDPTNSGALSNRGFVYYQMGEFEKNIADYTKFLQIVPNDADIINTIGLSYSNLKNFDRAIIEFNKSIKINPKQGAFFMNRSFAYNGKGEKVNALNDALAAQKLGFKVNENYLVFLKNNTER